MATEKKFLGYTGTQQLITKIREGFNAADEVVLQAAKDYADNLGDNYDAAGVAQTKVNELANGQVKNNSDHIGVMNDLETAAKGDLVTAINEVRNAVSAGGTAAAITLTTATTPTNGMLKTYTLKQGNNTIGTIDIPKDMVVQSGSVVTNPDGQTAGTYIKLVLANATNDEIYVNVGTLVDIYTAQENASQVQLTIDSATRVISASIVNGAITTNCIADSAVNQNKIQDGSISKAKLDYFLQNIIDDTASQDYVVSVLNSRIGDLSEFSSAESVEEALMHFDSEIIGMDNRIDTLENTTYTEITADEVDAMFA